MNEEFIEQFETVLKKLNNSNLIKVNSYNGDYLNNNKDNLSQENNTKYNLSNNEQKQQNEIYDNIDNSIKNSMLLRNIIKEYSYNEANECNYYNNSKNLINNEFEFNKEYISKIIKDITLMSVKILLYLLIYRNDLIILGKTEEGKKNLESWFLKNKSNLYIFKKSYTNNLLSKSFCYILSIYNIFNKYEYSELKNRNNINNNVKNINKNNDYFENELNTNDISNEEDYSIDYFTSNFNFCIEKIFELMIGNSEFYIKSLEAQFYNVLSSFKKIILDKKDKNIKEKGVNKLSKSSYNILSYSELESAAKSHYNIYYNDYKLNSKQEYQFSKDVNHINSINYVIKSALTSIEKNNMLMSEPLITFDVYLKLITENFNNIFNEFNNLSEISKKKDNKNATAKLNDAIYDLTFTPIFKRLNEFFEICTIKNIGNKNYFEYSFAIEMLKFLTLICNQETVILITSLNPINLFSALFYKEEKNNYMLDLLRKIVLTKESLVHQDDTFFTSTIIQKFLINIDFDNYFENTNLSSYEKTENYASMFKTMSEFLFLIKNLISDISFRHYDILECLNKFVSTLKRLKKSKFKSIINFYLYNYYKSNLEFEKDFVWYIINDISFDKIELKDNNSTIITNSYSNLINLIIQKINSDKTKYKIQSNRVIEEKNLNIISDNNLSIIIADLDLLKYKNAIKDIIEIRHEEYGNFSNIKTDLKFDFIKRNEIKQKIYIKDVMNMFFEAYFKFINQGYKSQLNFFNYYFGNDEFNFSNELITHYNFLEVGYDKIFTLNNSLLVEILTYTYHSNFKLNNVIHDYQNYSQYIYNYNYNRSRSSNLDDNSLISKCFYNKFFKEDDLIGMYMIRPSVMFNDNTNNSSNNTKDNKSINSLQSTLRKNSYTLNNKISNNIDINLKKDSIEKNLELEEENKINYYSNKKELEYKKFCELIYKKKVLKEKNDYVENCFISRKFTYLQLLLMSMHNFDNFLNKINLEMINSKKNKYDTNLNNEKENKIKNSEIDRKCLQNLVDFVENAIIKPCFSLNNIYMINSKNLDNIENLELLVVNQRFVRTIKKFYQFIIQDEIYNKIFTSNKNNNNDIEISLQNPLENNLIKTSTKINISNFKFDNTNDNISNPKLNELKLNITTNLIELDIKDNYNELMSILNDFLLNIKEYMNTKIFYTFREIMFLIGNSKYLNVKENNVERFLKIRLNVFENVYIIGNDNSNVSHINSLFNFYQQKLSNIISSKTAYEDILKATLDFKKELSDCYRRNISLISVLDSNDPENQNDFYKRKIIKYIADMLLAYSYDKRYKKATLSVLNIITYMRNILYYSENADYSNLLENIFTNETNKLFNSYSNDHLNYFECKNSKKDLAITGNLHVNDLHSKFSGNTCIIQSNNKFRPVKEKSNIEIIYELLTDKIYVPCFITELFTYYSINDNRNNITFTNTIINDVLLIFRMLGRDKKLAESFFSNKVILLNQNELYVQLCIMKENKSSSKSYSLEKEFKSKCNIELIKSGNINIINENNLDEEDSNNLNKQDIINCKIKNIDNDFSCNDKTSIKLYLDTYVSEIINENIKNYSNIVNNEIDLYNLNSKDEYNIKVISFKEATDRDIKSFRKVNYLDLKLNNLFTLPDGYSFDQRDYVDIEYSNLLFTTFSMLLQTINFDCQYAYLLQKKCISNINTNKTINTTNKENIYNNLKQSNNNNNTSKNDLNNLENKNKKSNNLQQEYITYINFNNLASLNTLYFRQIEALNEILNSQGEACNKFFNFQINSYNKTRHNNYKLTSAYSNEYISHHDYFFDEIQYRDFSFKNFILDLANNFNLENLQIYNENNKIIYKSLTIFENILKKENIEIDFVTFFLTRFNINYLFYLCINYTKLLIANYKVKTFEYKNIFLYKFDHESLYLNYYKYFNSDSYFLMGVILYKILNLLAYNQNILQAKKKLFLEKDDKSTGFLNKIALLCKSKKKSNLDNNEYNNINNNKKPNNKKDIFVKNNNLNYNILNKKRESIYNLNKSKKQDKIIFDKKNYLFKAPYKKDNSINISVNDKEIKFLIMFYKKFETNVEFVTKDNKLKRISALTNPKSIIVTKKEINEMIKNANFDTHHSKISSLLEFIKRMEIKIKFFDNNNIEKLQILFNLNYKLFDLISLLISFIINFLLLWYNDIPGTYFDSNESYSIKLITLILTIVQIINNVVGLICYGLSKFKFKIFYFTQIYKNLTDDYLKYTKKVLYDGIIMDNEIRFMIFNILVAVVAVSKSNLSFLYSIQLITLLKFLDTIREVFKAFQDRIIEVLYMVLFLIIIVQLFSIIAFISFRKKFLIAADEDDDVRL